MVRACGLHRKGCQTRRRNHTVPNAKGVIDTLNYVNDRWAENPVVVPIDGAAACNAVQRHWTLLPQLPPSQDVLVGYDTSSLEGGGDCASQSSKTPITVSRIGPCLTGC
jgi:hypothetical protein